MPTYFVSPTGSNGNNGGQGDPWKTLNYAGAQLNPGDTLYIRGGTYREWVKFPRHGLANARILISNWEDEVAIVDTFEGTVSEPASSNTDNTAYTPAVGLEGSYVTLNGLKVTNADRFSYRGISIYPSAFNANNPIKGTIVQNCTAWQTAAEPIWMAYGSDCIIQDCRAWHGGYNRGGTVNPWHWAAGGIELTRESTNCTIRRCWIGETQNEAILIDKGTNNCLIEYCVAWYTESCAFYANQTKNVTFDSCIAIGAPIGFQAATESDGFATYGHCIGTTFQNCLSVDCGWAYVMDVKQQEASLNDSVIRNSTSVNSTIHFLVHAREYPQWSGQTFPANCPNCTFENNLAVGGTAANISGVGWTLYNNLFYDCTSVPSHTGLVTSNPLLVNRNAGHSEYVIDPSNWSIQTGSPAINAGRATSITDDYWGGPRVGLPDIGFHEFGTDTSQDPSGGEGPITDPPAPVISANFTASVTSGYAPLVVTFTDTSTVTGGVTDRVWRVNGTIIGSDPVITHTFSSTGTHTVKLTVTGEAGEDSKSISIIVTEHDIGDAAEKLVNPDFVAGNTGWNTYSVGSISFSFVNSQVQVSAGTTGGNAQLYQFGIGVGADVEYELVIDTDIPGGTYDLQIRLIEHEPPNTFIGLNQTLALSGADTNTIHFTATLSTSNARLQVWFPSTLTADLVINSISLKERTVAPPVIPGVGNDIVSMSVGAIDTTQGSQTFIYETALTAKPRLVLGLMTSATSYGTRADRKMFSISATTPADSFTSANEEADNRDLSEQTTGTSHMWHTNAVFLDIENKVLESRATMSVYDENSVTVDWVNASDTAYLSGLFGFRSDRGTSRDVTLNKTANSTAIADFPFTPNLVIVMVGAIHQPDNTTIFNRNVQSIGFLDENGNQAGLGFHSGNSVNYGDPRVYLSTTGVPVLDNSGLLTNITLAQNGKNITLTNTSATTYRLYPLVIGLRWTDRRTHLIVDTTPTSTGTKTYNFNFVPGVVWTILSGLTSNNLNSHIDTSQAGRFSMGLWNTESQYNFGWHSADAVTDFTNTGSYMNTGNIIELRKDTGEAGVVGAVTGAGPATNTVDINFTTVETSLRNMIMVAIEGDITVPDPVSYGATTIMQTSLQTGLRSTF